MSLVQTLFGLLQELLVILPFRAVTIRVLYVLLGLDSVNNRPCVTFNFKDIGLDLRLESFKHLHHWLNTGQKIGRQSHNLIVITPWRKRLCWSLWWLLIQYCLLWEAAWVSEPDFLWVFWICLSLFLDLRLLVKLLYGLLIKFEKVEVAFHIILKTVN